MEFAGIMLKNTLKSGFFNTPFHDLR